MSGRLVILRHKSWHVWNQDNIEKVLKDERENKEKIEKEQLQKRLNDQDYSLELLRQQANDNDDTLIKHGDITTTRKLDIYQDNDLRASASHPHLLHSKDDIISIETKDIEDNYVPKRFCLFDSDLDIMSKKKLGNEEYEKDKIMKEKYDKKKQGVEPWSLGDPSLGKNGIKPWYIGSTLTSHTGIQSDKIIDKNGRIETEKESLKRKRDRESRRKESSDPMARLLAFQNTTKHFAPRTKSTSDQLDIDALRKKRLERENIERKKTKTLLSNPDIISHQKLIQYDPNIRKDYYDTKQLKIKY